MESENETRPLLHDFESETWRSKARKRCLRIPSEVAITGIILGLFFVVVTLLIVLENMEDTKESEISVDKSLLASPFKYNKKADDMSWQDKKDSFKPKNKQNDLKWDNANKGWKKFPDISEQKDPDLFKNAFEDTTEIISLLQSPNLQWDEIDAEWKRLTKQGWKDKELRDAFVKALKEKEEELKGNGGVLQSPMKLDQLWNKINDSWKKKIQEGNKELEYQKMKGKKEKERQKTINDDWKNKMGLLQSPKADMKNIIKEDDGWKKLSGQGWKISDIKRAIIEAWKEKEEDLSQSPMNLQNLWGKATGTLKNIIRKGMDKQKSQKDINDDWADKFGGSLQSPKSSIKKESFIDELLKKRTKYDPNDKSADKAGQQADNPQKINYKNFLEDIVEMIKEHQKDRETENFDKAGKEKEKIQYSSMNVNDFLKDIIDTIKEHQKDPNDKSADKAGQQADNPQKINYKNFLEDIVEMIKEHHKDRETKNFDKAGKEKEKIQYSSMNVEDFLKDIIDTIKEHQKGNKEAEKQKTTNNEWKNMNVLSTSKKSDQKWKKVDDHWKALIEYERNSHFGKNDDSVTTDDGMQHTISFDNIKWDKTDSGWKKLTDQGWKDKDLKEAVYKAWKDGDKLLQSAMGYNNMKWKKVNDGWKKISNKSLVVPTRCPISKSQRALLLGSAVPAPPIDCALITEEVRREFGRCIDLSFLPKSCKPAWRTKCFSSYKYRKVDGTCNNKIHPTWGKSSTPFVRMIAPNYADGVSTFRTAKNGGPLPNSRLLSRKLYSKRMKPDSDTSLLFLYFGLLVDHDMVETATNSASIPCCEEEFQANPQGRPKECLQIDISEDDPFYGPKNVTCLNLVRSVPVNGECGGRREQLNKATSYLDGSAIYGSIMEHSKHLRTYSRGQLRTQLINNAPFMTNAEGSGYSCGTPSEPLKCFDAGDSRVNMMVELTAMHTLWYREHNRIATELHKINPQWQDETLYQETRRIVIGEIQHITYNELLPLLLGKKATEEYEIKIDESIEYEGYDDTIDATVFNVFGAAAYRFGHTLAPDMQYLLGPNNSTEGKIALHETFFSANILYHDGLDLLLRGAAVQRTQSVDSYITPEVREHLFQPADLDYGYDLAAVGIQRGRDHGLPPYIRWRSVCGLSEVKTWEDLYKVMDKDRADMFKTVYQSVEDIDLIPGALAENPEPGSLLGPTYVCLIGRQFKKTRKGDRFWFEIQNEIGSFTKGQLEQIYKSNMARIICDNSDSIKEIQRYPFKVPSDHNPVLDCDGIQKVDLAEWIFKF